jgi:DNA-binding MarR family transcriptional regulator
MSLEQEIRQREFKNEYHKAIVNLMFTTNHLVDRMSQVFNDYDITLPQYNVLRIVRGQHPHPCSINLIRERMLNKMSDASRIVERLTLKGLLQRCTSSVDKRSTEVSITPEGLRLLEQLTEPVDEFEAYLRHLSPHEIKALNQMLDKIRMPAPVPEPR